MLLDDRLLVAWLLGERLALRRGASLATTTYWYYRACRGAVIGGSGYLSGPFGSLADDEQAAAIEVMLRLPADVALPEPRALVPQMVEVHRRHRQLNLLNLEAASAALVLGSRVLLSPAAGAGVLPGVLTSEGVEWEVVELL